MLASTRAGWLLGSATIAATTLMSTSSGFAQTDSGTMTVQAQVVQTCTMGTIDVLDFGVITPGETKEAEADFVVNCNIPGTVVVAIDDGQNKNGASWRQMSGATLNQLIGYFLYSDSTRSNRWTAPVEKTVITGDNPMTVYGRTVADSSVNAPADNYSDSVTITVSF